MKIQNAFADFTHVTIPLGFKRPSLKLTHLNNHLVGVDQDPAQSQPEFT